jgi:hypothetical protein
MIFRTLQLSSSPNTAIEELVLQELQDPDNLLFRGCKPKVASPAERQNAALNMRYQLYLMDRSQHRMSIEELAADLLEHPGAELPA